MIQKAELSIVPERDYTPLWTYHNFLLVCPNTTSQFHTENDKQTSKVLQKNKKLMLLG